MFPLTYFDIRHRNQFDAGKNTKRDYTLVQPYLDKYSLNRQPPPYHAALLNQVAGMRKYKFRADLWNGSEVHMSIAKDAAVIKDTKERIEYRKDVARYEHFHHQDLMTQKELARTSRLFVTKMFSRISQRENMYVGLMNREAFMEHVRDKMMLHWDEGQRSAQLAEYRIQGMSPGGAPLTTHNLAADSQAELRMLAKTKSTIDPESITTIERLLASHAMQAAVFTNSAVAENASANHMKAAETISQVSSVAKSSRTKAS